MAALQARRDSNQRACASPPRMATPARHAGPRRQRRTGPVAAQAELRAQEAALRETTAEIAQQRSRVAAARTDLGFTRITAPMDGEVVALNTLEGQTVVASYRVPNILAGRPQHHDRARPGVRGGRDPHPRAAAGLFHRARCAGPALPRPPARDPAVARENQQCGLLQCLVRRAQPRPQPAHRHDRASLHRPRRGEAGRAGALSALGPRRPDGRFPARVLHADGSVEHRRSAPACATTSTPVLEGLREGERVVTGDSTDAAAPAPASNRAARQARGPALAARPATSRSA